MLQLLQNRTLCFVMPRTKEGQPKGDRGRRRRYRGVGKRRTLGEDSILGYSLSLQEIDLNQLISRKHFTVLYIILYNRYRIELYTLANTRANRFAFIDITCTINIAKFLNIKAT